MVRLGVELFSHPKLLETEPQRGAGGERAGMNGGEVRLGERVLYCKLIRDKILRHFDPRKLNDLQYVLELRCFKGLLSDQDLKEVYFERLWGFSEDDFVPAKSRELSEADMHQVVPSKVDISNVLARVPETVFWSAARGALVLREVKLRGVDGIVRGDSAWKYVIWACQAELDASLVCTLADRSERRHLELAVMGVAGAGGSPRACNPVMLDLLVRVYCMRLRTLVL